MKRRIMVVTLVLVCVLALSFALIGCKDPHRNFYDGQDKTSKEVLVYLKNRIDKAKSFNAYDEYVVGGLINHKVFLYVEGDKCKGRQELPKEELMYAQDTDNGYKVFTKSQDGKWYYTVLQGEVSPIKNYRRLATTMLDSIYNNASIKYDADSKTFKGKQDDKDVVVTLHHSGVLIEFTSVDTDGSQVQQTYRFDNIDGDTKVTLPANAEERQFD